eukprot:976615-Karenia_brevis.AAC.1
MHISSYSSTDASECQTHQINVRLRMPPNRRAKLALQKVEVGVGPLFLPSHRRYRSPDDALTSESTGQNGQDETGG